MIIRICAVDDRRRLEPVREDDVRIIQAAILFIELIILVVFYARRHTVVGRHVHIVLLLAVAGAGVAHACILLLHSKHKETKKV